MLSNDNNIGDGDENEPVDTSAERAGSRLGKRMQLATLHCQTTHVQLEQMIEATEWQVEQEKLQNMCQDKYHKEIMAIQQRTCDIQELALHSWISCAKACCLHLSSSPNRCV